ncbi:class II glutamine amidotransferase [Streptomyces sp. 4N509B]|uniref:class II glutamine amidotransferase n=1 Tax=Streptomyces sp. 4N509B TaxID=3457413 RepID=UPI003FD0B689
MCRHLAYLGPSRSLARLLLKPAHGLLSQAWAPRLMEPLAGGRAVNADGFGIGWYPPVPDTDAAGRPARYRRAVPVWTDANLPDLARAIHTPAVLAAVRCATPGTGHEESAAAPFARGRWLFSHNGSVEDWARLPGDLGLRLGADTLLGLAARSDSAVVWLLLGERLAAGEPAGGALAAVARSVLAVRPTARLTLLLTDGRSVAAVRHGPSLWVRTAPGEVLVASEPTDAPPDAPPEELPDAPHDAFPGGRPRARVLGDWTEVPDRSLLLATRGTATTVPLRERTPPHDRHRPVDAEPFHA